MHSRGVDPVRCCASVLVSGKEQGHDVDLLISHPVEGREKGLLELILARLEQRSMVLYGHWERSTYSDEDMVKENIGKGTYLKSTFDNFEKWIGVLRIENNVAVTGGSDKQSDDVPAPEPDPCLTADTCKLLISRWLFDSAFLVYVQCSPLA
jgi:hypothetical protein